MEDEVHRTSTNSPLSTYTPYSGSNTRSPPRRSSLDSLAESSISSIQSSLSGFSPRHDDLPSPPHIISPREEGVISPLHRISPREEDAPPPPLIALPVANRYVWSEPKIVTKANSGIGDGFNGGTVKEGHEEGRGKKVRPPESISRMRSNKEAVLKKIALGFRAFGFVFCLISFSVMAADKNQGWAIDSFYRYKEFRYSLSVNVIGFVYSLVQTIDLAYQLITGNYAVRQQFLYFIVFAIDQVLSYLLLSASSSAAIRVDDWESNWGADKFPTMARASVGVSFMAFVSLACNSMISGYSLYTSRYM